MLSWTSTPKIKEGIFTISEEVEIAESDLDKILEFVPEHPVDLVTLALLEKDDLTKTNMREYARQSLISQVPEEL